MDRPFANDEWDARHTLREIRLMKLLGPHPNVISLFDLSVYEEKAELYMVMELMDCDLHRIIQSKQALTEMHLKTFALQLLEGVRAMHSVGVFHRDLKPGNLLVSKDCQLRITDFGLARFMDAHTLEGDNASNPMTEYVVTRWYRCPELLLAPARPYSTAVDMWAVGCIVAELFRRKPLFPGKSYANQVQLIFEARGYQPGDDLGFPLSSEAASFLDRRCRFPAQRLGKLLPQASPDALALLEALLAMDPGRRPDAATALGYRFLADVPPLCDYSNVRLKRASDAYFDFELEKNDLAKLRAMVVAEVGLPVARVPTASSESLKPETRVQSAGEAGGDGPMSQMRTAVQRAPKPSNPYAAEREGRPPMPIHKEPRKRPSEERERRRSSEEKPAVRRGSREEPAVRRPSQELALRELERAVAGAHIHASAEPRRDAVAGILAQLSGYSYRSASANTGSAAREGAVVRTKASLPALRR